MKYILNNVYIVLFVIICSGCPEPTELPDRELILINNSNKTIVYHDDFTFDNEIDTVFYNGRLIMDHNGVSRSTLLPNQEKIEDYYSDVLNNHLSNDKLIYYFFDRKVVDSLTWQEISEKYLVLKRVTINSIDQLDSMNWTITYP